MNILVAIKHAIDYEVDVSVNVEGTGVETERVSFAMNPFDEVALEAAVQLKEQGYASSITVVTIGSDDAEPTLRTALASGADEAILIETTQHHEPLNVAKILQKVADHRDITAILLGKQSLDQENEQTGAMLASCLSFPLLTCVAKIELQAPSLKVMRTTDIGTETFLVNAPFVLTCNLSLCQPRFATLPEIMRAKKVEIEKIDLNGFGRKFGVSFEPRMTVTSVRTPEPRKACQLFESVEELLAVVDL